MIHYICDRCQRTMNPEMERRYVVHIDVEVVAEDNETDCVQVVDDEAIDHLADLNDTLESEMLEETTESLEYLNDMLCRGEDLASIPDHDETHPMNEPAIIEALDQDEAGSIGSSFDLCPECYAKYARNPLSVDRMLKLHFSNN
ncbi:hypothetical protein [Neorhodopirellula lusitana]|uniref:hypothetical protein n=1 Tax=Neorhodopirellula lusitana TaxID=445327 RepID=UPI00384A910A